MIGVGDFEGGGDGTVKDGEHVIGGLGFGEFEVVFEITDDVDGHHFGMGSDDVLLESGGGPEMIFAGDVFDGVDNDILEIIAEEFAEFGFAEGLVGAGAEGFIAIDIIHDEIDGLFEIATGVDLLDDVDGVGFKSIFEEIENIIEMIVETIAVEAGVFD